MDPDEFGPDDVRAAREAIADDENAAAEYERGRYDDDTPYDERMNRRAATGDRDALQWVYLNLK